MRTKESVLFNLSAEQRSHLQDVAVVAVASVFGLAAAFFLTGQPEQPNMRIDCQTNPLDFDTLEFPAADFNKDLLIEAGSERRKLTISREDGIIRVDGFRVAQDSIGEPLMYFDDGSELVSGRPATTLDVRLGNQALTLLCPEAVT